MPLLDVSELLGDPMFADDITVIRSTRSVSTGGRTVDTPSSYNTYGNVQPASEAQLQQLPDLERVGSYISVVTPFPLYCLTDTTAPDQVKWNHGTYRVAVVRDYTTYGSGFVEALCQLVTFTMVGP